MRLKRGRNMQTGAGGRYAAALGRSKGTTCALRGAQSGSMLIRYGGVIVLSSHTFKSTASSEKQLHNVEFHVIAIMCSVGSVHEGDALESASETIRISKWGESNCSRARRRGLGK